MNLLNVKPAVVPSSEKIPTVEELIFSNKIRITHRSAVLQLVIFWAELSHTWKWQLKKSNRGPCGYPLGLVDGIKFIDRLLTGNVDGYPLYSTFGVQRWTVPQIQRAMEQFNIAASSPKHQPLDPARKKHLQRLCLSNFFWNGRIKGEPNPYTHAPFLFFFERGAVLHENSIEKYVPISGYLFNALHNIYKDCCENPHAPLSNIDHNRLVRFSDAIYTHYKEVESRLATSDQNLGAVVNIVEGYFRTWRRPIRLQAFTCTKAITDLKQQLVPTSIASVPCSVAPQPVEIQDSLLPTATLAEVSDGDFVKTLCAFCAKQGDIVDPYHVDARALLAHGNLALRQVARLWRLGRLRKAEKVPAPTADWKNLIAAQKAKLGIA